MLLVLGNILMALAPSFQKLLGGDQPSKWMVEGHDDMKTHKQAYYGTGRSMWHLILYHGAFTIIEIALILISIGSNAAIATFIGGIHLAIYISIEWQKIKEEEAMKDGS